jgi:ubiquinone/menaquinone biosynthesis C-methylase UbiE
MLTPLFWKKYFEEYDLLNELIPYQELLNTICINAKVQKGHHVLDLGSGTGNLSMVLERYGARVTAVDFSKEGIEIHKMKSKKAKFLHYDITKPLPFNDNQFDAVVSNNVLYTISRDKRLELMHELYRITKKGGHIVISNIIEGFNPSVIYFDHINRMCRRYGVIKTVLKVIKLSWPTIKIFYYNYLINKENNTGFYEFFRPGEQREILEISGFKNVSTDISSYSHQAVINLAIK